MVKKKSIKEIILPNQKINFFVITIMILGIISGSIFLMILNQTDKNNVILQIKNFFDNIRNNKIDNGQALKNSLIINYIWIGCIWILGLSMIGIVINIFLTYIKGFILGFSISSIFLTYKYKGIIASLLFCIPTQIINITIIITLTIYSIMFSNNLLKIIISKKGNNRLMLKKYSLILMICIIGSFISSLLEAYFFPNILKLVINIYK